MPLAHILGSTPHVSPLLRKARRLGYAQADDLLELAVARGCRHYSPSGGEEGRVRDCGRDCFTNEELAAALVSGSLEGDARHVRVAAQLLGAPGVNAAKVARLARMERCVPILRYIAEAGLRDSGKPSFWKALLEQLPASDPIPEGRMPHPRAGLCPSPAGRLRRGPCGVLPGCEPMVDPVKSNPLRILKTIEANEDFWVSPASDKW